MLAAKTAPDVTAAAEPLVSVTNVQKTYFTRRAPVQAVASASVDVARGEFVSLLGPSGCGKSTLLMMIAGLEQPTGGSISLAGTEVREPRRDIGVIFQDATLLPWKSALDNVLFPVRILKLPIASAPESCWRWSDYRTSRTRSLRNCRAECGNAWRSAGR
jgi:NitT/TauT family transport system ATP-binding protein